MTIVFKEFTEDLHKLMSKPSSLGEPNLLYAWVNDFLEFVFVCLLTVYGCVALVVVYL